MTTAETLTRSNENFSGTKEAPAKTPFLIRPHHLYQFALLMENTADELARDINDFHKGEVNKNEKAKAHAIDIYGPSLDFDDQQKKLKNVFSRFLKLEDDHPVHIGCGIDEICKGCYFGEHCRKKNIESFGGTSDVVQKEEEFLSFFLRKTGEKDEIKIVEKEIILWEGIEKVRTVITDAKTVKNILFGTNYTGSVTL